MSSAVFEEEGGEGWFCWTNTGGGEVRGFRGRNLGRKLGRNQGQGQGQDLGLVGTVEAAKIDGGSVVLNVEEGGVAVLYNEQSKKLTRLKLGRH